MISINNLSMAFGARLLFDGVNLNLLKGNRYGLVGANGSGKSTFLTVLTGEEEPSLGEVTIPSGMRIGWLKQDHFQYENDKIIHAVIRGNAQLWKAIQEKEQLLKNDVWNEETGCRLGELEEVIAHLDGYTAETLAEKLLIGLGIPLKEHHNPLSSLSGGYKLRVLLAQSLFNNPDILLLDEPTNHLDIMSIAWLEEYLKAEFKGLLLFISHDHSFLNNLASHILDIDYGDIRLYHGNYQTFLIQKQQLLDQKGSERLNLERRVAQLQTFVDRFKAKASKARQAQSKLKMIERIELPDIEKSSRLSPAFSFKQTRLSGKVVVAVKDLSKSFGDKKVLRQVHFSVKRGEKVVLIGHNGIGKSTLLKTMLDLVPQDSGQVEWGYEAHISYFAQEHHDLLKENTSAYDWLCHQAEKQTTSRVRSVLGQVLFTQDDAHKNILSLSGGEGARLLLAKVMLEEGNVLILDEPTNHLDLESIEALAKALQNYEGTLIFVSHDRHFVSKVANRVLAFTEKGVKDYLGPYKEYLRQYGEDYLSREWLQGTP
jgi:ATPase subunit of ABC transporter with duplicated ATPase domains